MLCVSCLTAVTKRLRSMKSDADKGHRNMTWIMRIRYTSINWIQMCKSNRPNSLSRLSTRAIEKRKEVEVKELPKRKEKLTRQSEELTNHKMLDLKFLLVANGLDQYIASTATTVATTRKRVTKNSK